MPLSFHSDLSAPNMQCHLQRIVHSLVHVTIEKLPHSQLWVLGHFPLCIVHQLVAKF